MTKKSAFFVVFAKELKELFRDKKTIISTIVIPIVIYPLLMFFIGGGIKSVSGGDTDIVVAVTGEVKGGVYSEIDSEDKEAVKAVFESYNSSGNGRKIIVREISNDTLNAQLENGDLSVILTIQQGFKNLSAENLGSCRVAGVVDMRSNQSAAAYSEVMAVLKSFSETVFNARLEGRIGDVSQFHAIEFKNEISLDQLTERSGTGNPFVLMIIPMLITMLISVGGATIAVDLIAGEKERGTFEPLLSTGANRFSVLSAKYAVVVVFAIINAVIQVTAMALSMGLTPGMKESMSGALNLSAGGVILGVVNVLLLSAMFCSVMLCLASTAKSFKEASAKTSFLVFLPIMLSYVLMFTDAVNINMGHMVAPVVNVVAVIKMLLSGYVNYLYFFISIGVNCVYLSAAVYMTFKMFSKESLITRG